jgi:hypothetical protein
MVEGKWRMFDKVLLDSPIMALQAVDVYGLGFKVLVAVT